MKRPKRCRKGAVSLPLYSSQPCDLLSHLNTALNVRQLWCTCLGRHKLLGMALSNTDRACQSWARVASSDLRIIVRQEGFKNLNPRFLTYRKTPGFLPCEMDGFSWLCFFFFFFFAECLDLVLFFFLFVTKRAIDV